MAIPKSAPKQAFIVSEAKACKGNPGAVMVIGTIISQEALSLTLISYVPAPNPENDVS